MVALRSLTSEGEVLPVVTETLVEQRSRMRAGACLICGKSRSYCDCGEYDETYDRHQFESEAE